jgi:hypothetical protein
VADKTYFDNIGWKNIKKANKFDIKNGYEAQVKAPGYSGLDKLKDDEYSLEVYFEWLDT